jgi:hypothetical protein
MPQFSGGSAKSLRESVAHAAGSFRALIRDKGGPWACEQRRRGGRATDGGSGAVVGGAANRAGWAPAG